MNDESLVTFMAETRRILNERPLTRQEDHPNDLEPLTPNKLLLLRSEQPPPLGSWVVADNSLNDGDKLNSSRVHYGKDGLKNIYLYFRNDRNG